MKEITAYKEDVLPDGRRVLLFPDSVPLGEIEARGGKVVGWVDGFFRVVVPR